jgi:ABC-2 type transport system ATP-binding protein
MLVEAVDLTKTYGNRRAVDGASFTLYPGRVTGLLGPNGAGKTTTLRLMIGVHRGDGEIRYGGLPLAAYPCPGRVVGADLTARAFHPRRTVRDHLRMLAAGCGVGERRIDEVIGEVGLYKVADDRPGDFPLGLAQRLALASAILAEPDVLLLDEPATGLDRKALTWLCDYLRGYAAAGHVVFVASHLLHEMQLLADDVVVIGRGRIIAHASTEAIIELCGHGDVLVRVDDPARLRDALRVRGIGAVREGEDGIVVAGAGAEAVGQIAFEEGLAVRELRTRRATLERAFLELTGAAPERAPARV